MKQTDFEDLMYWLKMELEKNSELIKTEEDVARFVDIGSINSSVSRVLRAARDDDYMERLLKDLFWRGGSDL